MKINELEEREQKEEGKVLSPRQKLITEYMKPRKQNEYTSEAKLLKKVSPENISSESDKGSNEDYMSDKKKTKEQGNNRKEENGESNKEESPPN